MDLSSGFLEILALAALNLFIGMIGFVPSFLVTGLNINSFGLAGGTALSLTGEIFGAILGFYLYRFGFSKIQTSWKKSRFWNFMQNRPTRAIFFGVLLFRLIPFIPSGLVTAGASLTKISGSLFFIASSIGKIPAVLIEAAAVYGFTQALPHSVQYIAAVAILAATGILWVRKRKNGFSHSRQ